MSSARNVEILPFGPAGLRPMFERLGPATHVFLRTGAALLFMQHGAQKLFGMLGGFGDSGASVPLVSLMGLAGAMEFFGGLFILVGLLTRPVALALLGEMVSAFVIAHLPQGGFPVQNGGELPLLFAVSFAFLVGNGAGPLSIDNWIARRKLRRAAFEERGRFARAEPIEVKPRRRHTAA